MEARNRDLKDWVSAISRGQVQLPRFQRFEAWSYGQIASLLESVLNELPVGSMFVLQVEGDPPFKYRPINGVQVPDDARVSELLLDGQQRLTALWKSLNGRYQDRDYFVSFNERTDYDGIAVQSVKTTYKQGRKYPLWTNSPVELMKRGYVPVQLLLPGEETAQRVTEWVKEACVDSSEEVLEHVVRINAWRAKFSSFNIPFLSLPTTTSRAQVLEVFTRINTGFTPLSIFDIITADIEQEIGESLHDLLESLNGRVPGLARFGDVQDIILRTAALVQDKTPDRPSILELDWKKLVENWGEIVVGAEEAVKFLESEKVLDAQRLPTFTVLPALITLWSYAAKLTGDKLGEARTLLRKFLWRGFFTERYESSAHTAAIQDVRELRKIIRDGKEGNPAIFASDLPSKQELLEAGWPKKKDRLARAILLVSLKGGATDLADGGEIQVGNASQREYHHIFPEAYLKNQQAEQPAGLALNCALITWKTNRTIRDKEPLVYMRDRADASSLGDEEILFRLKSHSIPEEPLRENNYEAFLNQRADLVEAAMRALASGRPWSP
ncbi:GmrSD restriction endonuclease domain-containing protein [Streptomyces sp. SudanB182_2057]|uniref:GmrSD restriction endonuclease domain-containing protein n=1 Tax=Streptomyces sp. SudanB182_2057 TaxID=3035281 RepID=UPI003F556DCB